MGPSSHSCDPYFAVIPPSATMTLPVTNDDSSDARKSATLAISRGSPGRPIGWNESMVGVDLLEAAEHLRVGVVDRRVDPARGERVAADALLRVVEGDALAEHDDRALRRRVDRQERLGDEAVDGASC